MSAAQSAGGPCRGGAPRNAISAGSVRTISRGRTQGAYSIEGLSSVTGAAPSAKRASPSRSVTQVAINAATEDTPTSARAACRAGAAKRRAMRSGTNGSGSGDPTSNISCSSVVHSEACGNTAMKLATRARVSSRFCVGRGSHWATMPCGLSRRAASS